MLKYAVVLFLESALQDVAASVTLKWIIYPGSCVLHFQQCCILPLVAGIPHTKRCLGFFSIPPNPTKTV